MPSSKPLQVARLWALALGLSALIAAAGRRWPEPLPVDFGVVAALVLLPPLGMVVWLLARWRLPPGAGTPHGTESQQSAQERH